jgi:parallel beta-helix repeat protein
VKFTIITLVLLLISSQILLLDLDVGIVSNVHGTTIYVGGVGPGNYSKIQDGINMAKPGDAVFVFNGTYYGATINKTITLIGEDMNSTIIEGSKIPFNQPTIVISDDYVNITGFTLNNGGEGILIESQSFINISGNYFYNNSWGVYAYNSSGNVIANNLILASSGSGIYLEGAWWTTKDWNNIIFGNLISNGSGTAIHLADISGNHIYDNVVTNNHWGLYLDHADSNNISHNYFSENGDGVTLRHMCNWNNITENTIVNCDFGIDIIDDSNFNNIMANIFLNNEYGVNMPAGHSIANNHIFHNNFINNTNQAYDNNGYTNYWDNGYPDGGNYWSDFDEPIEGAYDDFHGPEQDLLGGDGIVDNGTLGGGGKNPYIADYFVRDYYPLIVPWGNYLYFSQGWNFVSIPNIQSNSDPIVIFNSIKDNYTALQYYDGSDPTDPWKHNHLTKPSELNDLDDINHNMGLWIEITEPNGIFYEIPGIPPETNQSIPLYKGWNMVGYPSFTKYNRTEALNNLDFGNQVDAVWTYNAMNRKWEEIGESRYFIKGHGYWIHVKTDCIWEVPL